MTKPTRDGHTPTARRLAAVLLDDQRQRWQRGERVPVEAYLRPHVSAYLARLARTYMLEVLGQDYIRTARAKGLRPRLVIYRHALRNTVVPLLTTIGIVFGGLLSGTFVVETIFNLPGLGSLAIQAIFARDYPVTLAIVVLFTLFYAGINLVVDLLYGWVDPRIRLGRGEG